MFSHLGFQSSEYAQGVNWYELDLLLARSPDDPQGIRVASVFELFVCLFVLCLIVGKYSHFSPHPPLFPSFILLSPLLLISKIFSVMNKK